MELKEKLIQNQRIFTGRIINLDLETVQLPNQHSAQREVIHHHGAVGILAIRKQKILLVQQWRQPLRQVTWEIPAGKIEIQETDLSQVAARELNEETGYQAAQLIKIGGFYSSPGFADEYLTLFWAKGLAPVIQKRPLDADEFVNVRWLSLSDVEEQIQQGTICDAKTLLAVAHWRQQLAGGN
ncbi:NUDIX hydrolase [Lactobacillus sp. DCY120]|uniref:NUDIX hydrolase n=1 Tax=Bombilactobacillus apium TaxID=2675299 RepID=A0A850R019_9LACO|nr:NUDIX hydrolase [Bombilactobacillus apium]NVY95690.1 NUDIX hydrolase [Bombilactobacillus apium]